MERPDIDKIVALDRLTVVPPIGLRRLAFEDQYVAQAYVAPDEVAVWPNG